MTQPGANIDLTDPKEPFTPFWWLARLSQRLMDRQTHYDVRENYVVGNHPLPNGDRRYKEALKSVQHKAKTNYIALVNESVVQKLRVKGFRFGPEGFADQEAQKVWQANDMDYQAPVLINNAATFGFAYALVSPPEEDDGEPVIARRDPRQCEIERDPFRPTKTIAGLEFWQDSAGQAVLAILYLPEVTYYFRAEAPREGIQGLLGYFSTYGMSAGVAKFDLIGAEVNPLGEVPLVRCDWRPEFGDIGCAEAELAFEIQDRLNETILSRLIITRSQAYRQRWASGVRMKASVDGSTPKPPWDPAADMIWIAGDDVKFGDFEQADITQILEAIRDDVGDLVAITQTPVTYLANRMVNVSGDTIQQVTAGHIAKIKLRQDAVGFFMERLQKIAFKYKGDTARATDTQAQTLWHIAEVRSFAEIADAMQKWTASGIPLQLGMEKSGQFTAEEIEWAVQEAERLRQEQMAREDQMLDKQLAMKAQTQSSPGGSNK